jgi:phosphatidylserine/phosphatidylglycerophosphate/cardiolipin synthase-like enzyme
MFRAIQCRTANACWSLIIVLGVTALSSGPSPSVIEAVIDREGACHYCTAVRAALVAAQSSIDLLLGDAELEGNPLWDDLVAAHERGVSVRVLLDRSDWAPAITEKNRPTIEYLSERGIEARFDDPEITLHAKLVIVDRETVILGSSNWNRYAFTDQEQTNIRIRDERVAGVYVEYFDRLWEERLAPGGIALPSEDVDRGTATIIPLPDGDETALYASLLLELLPGATRSVHVLMYRLSVYPGFYGSLTNEVIGALVAAAGRGLDVRVLIDDCRFYPDSAEANLISALYLYEHGIDVRFDAPTETTHAKLVVIDGDSVLLGSTNWNYYSMEKNVEANVAVLHAPEVAALYDGYFEILWSEGRAIGP